MSATLVVDAAIAAPEVIKSLLTVAQDVTSDKNAHKTVLQTAVDAGNAALASLQNPTIQSMVGQKTTTEVNDAVATGTSLVSEIESVIPVVQESIKQVEAFIAKWL